MEEKKKFVPNKQVTEFDKPFMNMIGEKLKKLRMDQHMSISELSKQTNISRRTIQLIEEGRVYPQLQLLLSLIHFFNIPYLQFFSELNSENL